jgi:hypothetical protein
MTKKKGRPPIEHDNRAVHLHIRHYNNWVAADAEIPGFQHYVAAAAWEGVGTDIDGRCNKDKPHAMGTLFRLLRTLPVISTETVLAAHGGSESNARKIAVSLRFLSKLVEKLLPYGPPAPPPMQVPFLSYAELVHAELAKLEYEMHYLEDWKGDEDVGTMAAEWYGCDAARA